jgi:hypothetical protein
MNLSWFNPISARWIFCALVLLALLALWRWWRERRGLSLLGLRLCVLLGLAVIAANPESLLPREREQKPRLMVLMDTSASMATRDVSGETRLGGALSVITNNAVWSSLDREFNLDLCEFAREVHAVDPSSLGKLQPTGASSDLGRALAAAVTHVAESKAQAGVLLISDGRGTDERITEAGQLALARSVPLWTWTLGGQVPRRDLAIETVSSEALAFSGAEVELAATLRQEGMPNRSFRVEMLRGQELLETREVVPDNQGLARVSLRVQAPEAGEQRYVFRTPPQPEEGDTANNERAVFLRSVGNKVRVLAAEGQPHWDTKFLVQALKRNPNVELTAVYRLNQRRHMAIVSALGNEARVETDLFPRTREQVDSFDVVLLGRGAEGFFDAQTETLLSDFVSRRGGSLVFSRGKPYGGRFQPLAKLEPVAWGSGVTPAVRMKPTDAGRDNPIFDLGAAGTLDELLQRLPALDQVSATLGEKPLATVLASAAGREGPVLLAYQRYGQGKVMSLNASGLWRWSFRELGQEESEAAYGRFWISLLQWLLSGSEFLPGSDVAFNSSRRYYSEGQPMQFLISTRNLPVDAYKPKIRISVPGTPIEVEPRRRGEQFVAEAGPFPPGTYQVTLLNNVGTPSELTQTLEVMPDSVEKRELSADPELMKRLALASGGSVLKQQEVGKLPQIVRQWEAAREIGHRQNPVWDRWWILAVVIALLGVEWWYRRREGLL